MSRIGYSSAARRITTGLGLVALVGCSPAPPPAHYQPRSRSITITTVPLLVKEARKVYPFLEQAFEKGGVLEGKEVYGFSPSTVTVVEGDTIRFTLINPEDDLHSFVLPDFAVSLPGGKAVDTSYVARHAGIYPILCTVAAHFPMMSGQLVVLSPAAMSRPADSVGTQTPAKTSGAASH